MKYDAIFHAINAMETYQIQLSEYVKTVENYPGRTKKSQTCFFMTFARGFFVSTCFFSFLHKKEMIRGAETAV